jgi:hypothetical protein
MFDSGGVGGADFFVFDIIEAAEESRCEVSIRCSEEKKIPNEFSKYCKIPLLG